MYFISDRQNTQVFNFHFPSVFIRRA